MTNIQKILFIFDASKTYAWNVTQRSETRATPFAEVFEQSCNNVIAIEEMLNIRESLKDPYISKLLECGNDTLAKCEKLTTLYSKGAVSSAAGRIGKLSPQSHQGPSSRS